MNRSILIIVCVLVTGCSKESKPSGASIPGLFTPTYTRTLNVLAGGQSNMTLYLGNAGAPTYFRDALREHGIDVNLALTAVSGSSQQEWAIGGARDARL